VATFAVRISRTKRCSVSGIKPWASCWSAVFACLHRLDRRVQIRTAPELSERSRLTAAMETGPREDYLGVFGAVWNLVCTKPTSEVLRQMRKQLHKERSFDFVHADTAFTQFDRIMGQASSTLLCTRAE
jgi:hypothetical protein